MPTLTKALITEAQPNQPTKTGSGRYMLRLIDAGEGSSAIYPPEVLQQAAADRIFPAGTRMHLDHPSAHDLKEQPIRSVKDWAAVLTEDAHYNPDTQALEAPIKVAAPYRPLIEDLWEYIGASIRAYVEAENKPGKPVATKFLPSVETSVDFVTAAGRGGKLLSVLESAYGHAMEATASDRRDQLSTAVKDAYQIDQDHYVWIRDFDEALLLVWFVDSEDRYWQQAFTIADDDLSVTLDGDPIEVRPTTTYVPVTAPQESAGQPETTTKKEQKMPEISQARLDELTAAEARAAQLQAERDAAITRAETAESERDTVKAESARDKAISEALSKIDRPDVEKARIRAALEARDGEVTETVVNEAVKAEDEYLSQVLPGGVRGFGNSNPANESVKPRTRDAWGDPINPKEK